MSFDQPARISLARIASPEPDFLRPLRRPHRLLWAICAALWLAALAAAMPATQAWFERERIRAALAAEPASEPAAALAPSRRAIATADGGVPALLAFAWQDTLLDIEQATLPGVQWLAIEHGVDGRLHLEGQARDVATAAAVTQRLASGAAWRDVSLRRIEPVRAASSASGGSRFEVTGRRPAALPEPLR